MSSNPGRQPFSRRRTTGKVAQQISEHVVRMAKLRRIIVEWEFEMEQAGGRPTGDTISEFATRLESIGCNLKALEPGTTVTIESPVKAKGDHAG